MASPGQNGIVRWWSQDSPAGELFVAATALGVCLVEWGQPERGVDPVERLAGLGRPVRERVAELADRWDAYAAGDRNALFDLPVDLTLAGTAFRKEVLAELKRLPPGETVTYGELASRVGRPGGAQAVGGAVGANPVPVVVPCHRVMAADGSLGGFSGGLATKRALLSHEGLFVPEGGWVASHRDD